MQDLAAKVAFITGGANGLGLALARVFGRVGVHVAIADLRRERIDQALALLRSEGCVAMGVELDVTDRSAYTAAADLVETHLGPVQLLFNNAGIGVMGRLADAKPADWDWIMGVNLGGVINGLCTFVPRMRARGQGGHIVSTASAAGLFASENLGIYVASKMAVVGAMEVLRAELVAESIGVSVICPHLMRTQIHEHAALRPARYQSDRSSGHFGANTPTATEIAAMTNVGMDPMEVAAAALRAVRDNFLYVIPYPELRGVLRSRFAALEAALPDTPADPARVLAEAPSLTFAPYEEALRQRLCSGVTAT